MRNWFEIRASAKAGVGEVLIYDEIGPSFWGEETTTAKDFDLALKALGAVPEILLRVNSPGGVVYDAIAIHNMLRAHPARVTARIDGIAASAASLVVMAADEIVMPENAFLLIHEPSMLAFGTSATLLAAAAELETIARSFVSTYAMRASMSEVDVAALMAEDRLMDAAEAVSLGLADRIAEPVKMTANFSLAKLPKAARERLAAAMTAEKDLADMASEIDRTACPRVTFNPTSKRSPSMATNETEQIRSEAREQQAPPPLAAQAPSPAAAAGAEVVVSPPQGATPAPVAGSETALADKLRSEYAEIATIAGQAARLGVTIDAADAIRKGISAEALRRSVLDQLAARAEASSVVAAAPSSSVAAESPIARRAKERAAAARG